MDNLPFKERVAQEASRFAAQYQCVFVDYEYLLCSEAFLECDYYIISAKNDNFRHQLGVHTTLTPDSFYQKCIEGELTPNDFDFQKPGETEKGVKGTVRRKMQAFPNFLGMMNRDLVVQEKFEKNHVICTIATTDCEVTMGFINSDKLRPKTLMKGDQIDWENAGTVDLILRKPAGSALFNEIIAGDNSALMKYFPKIKDLVSSEMYSGTGDIMKE